MNYQRSERLLDAPPVERRLTHDKVGILLTRISSVIERLQAWGVRVSNLSRLRAAERTLRETAACPGYPTESDQLVQVAEAIRLALDFWQIVEAIGDTASKRIANELQRSLKGTLEGTERTRAPFQFQTQFWFGAALARGGFEPVIPSDRTTNPDFVVQSGSLSYGVEVKRPEGISGVVPALKSASGQLKAANLHGVIVFDVSDCLDAFRLRFVSSAGESHQRIEEQFKAVKAKLSETVWNEEKREYRPGFEHIMGLWVVARGWRWVLSDLRAPQVFDYQGFHQLASARGNLWFHKSDEFFSNVVRGLVKGGLTVLGADQDSTEPITRPFWEDAPFVRAVTEGADGNTTVAVPLTVQ